MLQKDVCQFALRFLGYVLNSELIFKDHKWFAKKVSEDLNAFLRKTASKTSATLALWCFSILVFHVNDESDIEDMLKSIRCSLESVSYELSGSIVKQGMRVLERICKYKLPEARRFSSIWLSLYIDIMLLSKESVYKPCLDIRDQVLAVIKPGLSKDCVQQLRQKLHSYISSLKVLGSKPGTEESDLKKWSIVVICLGQILAGNRQSLNEVLQGGPARCFSHSNSKIRAEAFLAWESLIDFFSLCCSDANVRPQFTSPETVSLLMKPIQLELEGKQDERNVRMACVRAWVHLIACLGNSLADEKLFELAAVTFLASIRNLQSLPNGCVESILCIMTILVSRSTAPRTQQRPDTLASSAWLSKVEIVHILEQGTMDCVTDQISLSIKSWLQWNNVSPLPDALEPRWVLLFCNDYLQTLYFCLSISVDHSAIDPDRAEKLDVLSLQCWVGLLRRCIRVFEASESGPVSSGGTGVANFATERALLLFRLLSFVFKIPALHSGEGASAGAVYYFTKEDERAARDYALGNAETQQKTASYSTLPAKLCPEVDLSALSAAQANGLLAFRSAMLELLIHVLYEGGWLMSAKSARPIELGGDKPAGSAPALVHALQMWLSQSFSFEARDARSKLYPFARQLLQRIVPCASVDSLLCVVRILSANSELYVEELLQLWCVVAQGSVESIATAPSSRPITSGGPFDAMRSYIDILLFPVQLCLSLRSGDSSSASTATPWLSSWRTLYEAIFSHLSMISARAKAHALEFLCDAALRQHSDGSSEMLRIVVLTVLLGSFRPTFSAIVNDPTLSRLSEEVQAVIRRVTESFFRLVAIVLKHLHVCNWQYAEQDVAAGNAPSEGKSLSDWTKEALNEAQRSVELIGSTFDPLACYLELSSSTLLWLQDPKPPSSSNRNMQECKNVMESFERFWSTFCDALSHLDDNRAGDGRVIALQRLTPLLTGALETKYPTLKSRAIDLWRSTFAEVKYPPPELSRLLSSLGVVVQASEKRPSFLSPVPKHGGGTAVSSRTRRVSTKRTAAVLSKETPKSAAKGHHNALRSVDSQDAVNGNRRKKRREDGVVLYNDVDQSQQQNSGIAAPRHVTAPSVSSSSADAVAPASSMCNELDSMLNSGELAQCSSNELLTLQGKAVQLVSKLNHLLQSNLALKTTFQL